MKRVLLIIPNSSFLDNDLVFPSLGILYLLSVAEKLGYKIHYYNGNILEDGVYYTDNFDFSADYKDFDFVGISCTTPQASLAYKIKDKVQESGTKVVIGGPHAKYYSAECEEAGFDGICSGDGERIFKKLLNHEFKDDLQYIFTDTLSSSEMNSYPIPLRQKEYINRYKYILKDRLATTMMNSRGCPMKCEFCESSSTVCRRYSVDYFEKEVDSILGLGIKGIMIFDDIFAINPKTTTPYLEILKRKDLIFRCFGHAKIISNYPEFAKELADAGCVEMGFGAESASQKILDTTKKRTTVEQMHNLVNTVIQNGINVKAFFMIGLPGETLISVKETYKFISHYRNKYPDNFDFDLTVFFPYKGTVIGNNMRYNKELINLRLISDYSWKDIDSGDFGAYKKKQGKSDIVIESYDQKSKKVLLSAEDIYRYKEEIMSLSKRYQNDEIIERSI